MSKVVAFLGTKLFGATYQSPLKFQLKSNIESQISAKKIIDNFN